MINNKDKFLEAAIQQINDKFMQEFANEIGIGDKTVKQFEAEMLKKVDAQVKELSKDKSNTGKSDAELRKLAVSKIGNKIYRDDVARSNISEDEKMKIYATRIVDAVSSKLGEIQLEKLGVLKEQINNATTADKKKELLKIAHKALAPEVEKNAKEIHKTQLQFVDNSHRAAKGVAAEWRELDKSNPGKKISNIGFSEKSIAENDINTLVGVLIHELEHSKETSAEKIKMDAGKLSYPKTNYKKGSSMMKGFFDITQKDHFTKEAEYEFQKLIKEFIPSSKTITKTKDKSFMEEKYKTFVDSYKKLQNELMNSIDAEYDVSDKNEKKYAKQAIDNFLSSAQKKIKGKENDDYVEELGDLYEELLDVHSALPASAVNKKGVKISKKDMLDMVAENKDAIIAGRIKPESEFAKIFKTFDKNYLVDLASELDFSMEQQKESDAEYVAAKDHVKKIEAQIEKLRKNPLGDIDENLYTGKSLDIKPIKQPATAKKKETKYFTVKELDTKFKDIFAKYGSKKFQTKQQAEHFVKRMLDGTIEDVSAFIEQKKFTDESDEQIAEQLFKLDQSAKKTLEKEIKFHNEKVKAEESTFKDIEKDIKKVESKAAETTAEVKGENNSIRRKKLNVTSRNATEDEKRWIANLRNKPTSRSKIFKKATKKEEAAFAKKREDLIEEQRKRSQEIREKFAAQQDARFEERIVEETYTPNIDTRPVKHTGEKVKRKIGSRYTQDKKIIREIDMSKNNTIPNTPEPSTYSQEESKRYFDMVEYEKKIEREKKRISNKKELYGKGYGAISSIEKSSRRKDERNIIAQKKQDKYEAMQEKYKIIQEEEASRIAKEELERYNSRDAIYNRNQLDKIKQNKKRQEQDVLQAKIIKKNELELSRIKSIDTKNYPLEQYDYSSTDYKSQMQSLRKQYIDEITSNIESSSRQDFINEISGHLGKPGSYADVISEIDKYDARKKELATQTDKLAAPEPLRRIAASDYSIMLNDRNISEGTGSRYTKEGSLNSMMQQIRDISAKGYVAMTDSEREQLTGTYKSALGSRITEEAKEKNAAIDLSNEEINYIKDFEKSRLDLEYLDEESFTDLSKEYKTDASKDKLDFVNWVYEKRQSDINLEKALMDARQKVIDQRKEAEQVAEAIRAEKYAGAKFGIHAGTVIGDRQYKKIEEVDGKKVEVDASGVAKTAQPILFETMEQVRKYVIDTFGKQLNTSGVLDENLVQKKIAEIAKEADATFKSAYIGKDLTKNIYGLDKELQPEKLDEVVFEIKDNAKYIAETFGSDVATVQNALNQFGATEYKPKAMEIPETSKVEEFKKTISDLSKTAPDRSEFYTGVKTGLETESELMSKINKLKSDSEEIDRKAILDKGKYYEVLSKENSSELEKVTAKKKIAEIDKEARAKQRDNKYMIDGLTQQAQMARKILMQSINDYYTELSKKESESYTQILSNIKSSALAKAKAQRKIDQITKKNETEKARVLGALDKQSTSSNISTGGSGSGNGGSKKTKSQGMNIYAGDGYAYAEEATEQSEKGFMRLTQNMNRFMGKMRTTMSHISMLGGMVDQFAKMEESVYGLGIVAGKSKFQIAEMRNELISMSANSRYSVIELAQAAEGIIRTGRKYEEAMVIMSSAEKLAVASFDSLGNATDTLTKAMTAFSLSADSASHIANSFHNIVLSTPLDLKTLDESLRQTASAFGSIASFSTKSGEELEEYKKRVMDTNVVLTGLI